MSIRKYCLLLALAALAGGARAAQKADEDTARAIDLGIAMRSELVDRAHALRDVSPKDLRTRVLLSPTGMTTDSNRTLLLPVDPDLPELVEQARGSTDPVVLAQLAARCPSRPATNPCDALEMAQRWVDADTQNQVAWLALGTIQRERKDEAAARETFVRAAKASVWRDDDSQIGRHLLRGLPQDLSPAARTEALRTILVIESSSSVYRYFGYLYGECKDPNLAVSCHRILEVIARDADTLIAISVAARLSRSSKVPSQIVDERFRRYDATLAGLRAVDQSAIDDGQPSEAACLAFNQATEARIVHGEVAQARINLDAAGLSVDQAAARTRGERLEREERLEQSVVARPR